MGENGCVNGTLSDSNYSSPMPVIGLYIAAATSVCLLFILYDTIWLGFRERKRWLPCKLFSLNSLTLTLLSVAAKLPVDLTTSMPSRQDQLSKLTGTSLICICMVFFMPSLATMSRPESFSNMAALTILVVTVVVNICIQIGTGVIFSFVVEHVIVLLFMLLLLAMLWVASLEINYEKDRLSDLSKHRSFLVNGEGSVLQRLVLSYVYGYVSNPPLVICRTHYFATVGMLSAFCVAILAEAVLRSLILKKVNCFTGASDYQWSMWIIVVSQIVTVALGFAGNFFRWITLVHHIDAGSTHFVESKKRDFKLQSNKNSKPFQFQFLYTNLTYILLLVVSSTSKLVAVPLSKVVNACIQAVRFGRLYWDKDGYAQALQHSEEQSRFPFILSPSMPRQSVGWIIKEGSDYMATWMESTGKNPPVQLIGLLFNTYPSQDSPLNSIELVRGLYHLMAEHILERGVVDMASVEIPNEYTLSCLTTVMLVQWASVRFPCDLTRSLEHSLNEAFEMIYFVDAQLSVPSYENKIRLKHATQLWKYHTFVSCYDVIREREVYGQKNIFRVECDFIRVFIEGRELSNAQGLYNCLVQIYVDMLHWFLAKLPIAIFKYVLEGTLENLEERIRQSIEFLLKVAYVEKRILWEFPHGRNIDRLIAYARDELERRPVEDSETRVSDHVTNEDAAAVSAQSEIQPVHD